MSKLTAVAAISENHVLAKEGRLPWTPPEQDREQYQDLIRGHPLVFGETTYANAPTRNPEVPMLVLSYDPTFEPYAEAHAVANSKREALDWIAQHDTDVFVMGGGEIYRLFWTDLDELVISHIPGVYDGDVFFPEIRAAEWVPVETTDYDEFTRVIYRRP